MNHGVRTYRLAGRLATETDLDIVVLAPGLACCALEVDAAVRQGLLSPVDGADAASAVLVVAGTVTDALVPAVRQLLADLPAGTPVVSVGACAGTGGPYWDAPTVAKGIDQFLPVTRYVPGCPPRPEDLVAGLVAVVRRGHRAEVPTT